MEVQMIRSFKKGFTLAEDATHVNMLKCSRKSAFTLAEVLITLGIIGVVAAMTMPTLMNSTNGAQYKTAYKKERCTVQNSLQKSFISVVSGCSFERCS